MNDTDNHDGVIAAAATNGATVTSPASADSSATSNTENINTAQTAAAAADDDDEFSRYFATYYSQCVFAGHVILGVSKVSNMDTHKDDEDTLPMGVRFNTHISNSILEPYCTVYHNTLISNTFIAASAKVIQCGSIRWDGKSISSVSNDTDTYDDDYYYSTGCPIDHLHLTVGPETGGGRHMHVQVESTMMDIMVSLQPTLSSYLHPWIVSSQQYDPSCGSTTTLSHNVLIGSISHVDSLINVYCHKHSILQSCPSITNTILLPLASITHGCIVHSSLLQWNTSITNHSTVSSTLLMEHSHVGPNSLVQQTILGPDTHVSCGEVHCSILGPNTNAHHQSLIISTIWPLGRGNVAYGSNIGSNHTGRLPDQEMMSGEGIFYGLSTGLKFPIDLSASPYSMIAAGIILPPQRIGMPFSLITTYSNTESNKKRVDDDHAIIPSRSQIMSYPQNEIVPGWVLQSSPYTLIRNEEKFKTRRKAIRHSFYTGWTILRPNIIDCCFHSRKVLLDLNKETSWDTTEVYTLGLNVITERGRNLGIQAYTHLIQRYALQGLLEFVSLHLEQPKMIDELIDALQKQRQDYDAFKWSKYDYLLLMDIHASNTMVFPSPDDHAMNHALFVLLLEYPAMTKQSSIATSEEGLSLPVLIRLFDTWLNLENEFMQRVKKSKMRDNVRGGEIITDYDASHIYIEDDVTVRAAALHTMNLETKLRAILSKLEAVYESKCYRIAS